MMMMMISRVTPSVDEWVLTIQTLSRHLWRTWKILSCFQRIQVEVWIPRICLSLVLLSLALPPLRQWQCETGGAMENLGKCFCWHCKDLAEENPQFRSKLQTLRIFGTYRTTRPRYADHSDMQRGSTERLHVTQKFKVQQFTSHRSFRNLIGGYY